MTFAMNRPTNERFQVKAIPRAIRKPAPTGTTRALDETLVGSLDGVGDAKSSSAQPNYRRPLARHLVESQPVPARPARHRVQGKDGGQTPPLTSSLSSTVLGGALDLDSSATLRRGKKIVEPEGQLSHAKQGNFSLFKPPSPTHLHAGKRIFSEKLQEETCPASNRTLHKKPVTEKHAQDSPSMLRFSPRRTSARPSTAPAAGARPAATSTRGVGRPSELMRGVLSWTGATPRYGSLKVSHNLRPSRAPPSNPNTAPQLSATRISNAPFDTSFRQPVAGVPSEANARRRGPQKVTARPKTARGLLRWD
jgi:hypothetical protein